MATFKERLFHKVLKDNIIYELAGYDNGYNDGDISKEEFERMTTFDGAKGIADYIMTEAFKVGYLESQMDDTIIEAKHLKFMGTERMEHIKCVACRNALKQF